MGDLPSNSGLFIKCMKYAVWSLIIFKHTLTLTHKHVCFVADSSVSFGASTAVGAISCMHLTYQVQAHISSHTLKNRGLIK